MKFSGANDDGVVQKTAGEGLMQTHAIVSHPPDILKYRFEKQFNYNQPENHKSVYKFCRYKAERFFDDASIPLAASPAPRYRVHPTSRYFRGTLSPTPNTITPSAVSPGGIALLRAARDGDDSTLRDILHRANLVGISEPDLNAVDNSGRVSRRTLFLLI